MNFSVWSLIFEMGAVWTGSRKEVQVPIEAVIEELETPTPPDERETREQRDAREVAEFVTRQVLERGATFFDG